MGRQVLRLCLPFRHGVRGHRLKRHAPLTTTSMLLLRGGEVEQRSLSLLCGEGKREKHEPLVVAEGGGGELVRSPPPSPSATLPLRVCRTGEEGSLFAAATTCLPWSLRRARRGRRREDEKEGTNTYAWESGGTHTSAGPRSSRAYHRGSMGMERKKHASTTSTWEALFSFFFSTTTTRRALHASFVASDGSMALREPRRYSFKYARKPQHLEMRQPMYLHDKRHGLFSNEHNIGKARRGLPYITPLYTKHMNLWETDTDASTNRFFRSYVFGQRELHQLLGRAHAFESKEAAGKEGDSMYELHTDQRWKGMEVPMIRNLHWEPQWNTPLYPGDAHVQYALGRSGGGNLTVRQRLLWEPAGSATSMASETNALETSNRNPTTSSSRSLHEEKAPFTAGSASTEPRALTQAELLGPALVQVRDIKSVEHCKAWFDRLKHLIQLHYDAVGDIGDFKSRQTQHVHEFFVHFHDAMSHFDFQDAYLFQCFQEARPPELEDIFGIFIEMEANYVHPDYCPRCSLPYATTRYCGEGDETTPFRRHRGRWAPHQQWGKEWWDVVCRRAEALWYRSVEDPYFGVPHHTQRQVEAMLRVYVQTHQRAKAIDFFHRLYGSLEYLTGAIQVTTSMQQQLDELLDRTPHPHLLTNGFALQQRASVYTGEVYKVPHSPLQMLLDMKKNVFRRQQKEEGVIRIPPASWRIATDAIVPYQVDPRTKKITNWRAVKEGIEKAFLDAGLPREAYTAEEWRWVCYWRRMVATKGKVRARWEAERRKEEAAAARRPESPQQQQALSTNSTLPSSSPFAGRGGNWILFPTAHWYQLLDTSPEALAPFASALWKNARKPLPRGGSSSSSSSSSVESASTTAASPTLESGLLCVFAIKSLLTPQAVPFHDTVRQQHWLFDTTSAACRPFGDYETGEVLCIADAGSASSSSSSSSSTSSSTRVYTPVEVVVIGVHTTTSSSSSTNASTEGGAGGEVGKKILYAMYVDPVLRAERGFLALGSTADEVARTIHPEDKEGEFIVPEEAEAAEKSNAPLKGELVSRERRWGRQGRLAPIPFIEALRTAQTDPPEEAIGQILGVRQGQLYVQWRLLPGSGGGGGG